MTTFSQAVDYLVDSELRRPELRLPCAAAVNQVIHELHSKNDGSSILYPQNRCEASLTTDAVPYVWDFPSPASTFQQIEALFSVTHGLYLPKKKPSAVYLNESNPLSRFYWYQSGPTIVMAGVEVGTLIQCSYFAKPPVLKYYAESERPATYDPVDGFAVLDSWTGTDEEAIAASTNWILERYPSVVYEGVRAILYRRMNSIEQAKISYSAFQSVRQTIPAQEVA